MKVRVNNIPEKKPLPFWIVTRKFAVEEFSEIAAFLMDAIGVEKLANACSHMGVSSYPFQQKFGITGNDVKQFAKRGLLKITGNERFLSHGEAHYASLYSVMQYYTLTPEQVQEWKMEV